MMFVRTAGKALFAGILGLGGVSMTKPGWLGWAGMDYMPGFHALSKDKQYKDREQTYYLAANFGQDIRGGVRLGGKYRNYLVGIEKSNKAWWEWSYRRLQSDGVSTGKFKVTEGDGRIERAWSEGDNDKSLNQICDAAYKSTYDNNVFKDQDSGTGNSFIKAHVWKYCSPLGKEPTEITKDNYGTETIASENDTKFISTKDGSNDLFWFIRDKEIKGGDNNFEMITPSGSSGGSASTHFNQSYKSLKELCEEAYNSPKSGNSNGLNKDETKKYCEFDLPGMIKDAATSKS